jgi:hypothetical protein
VNMNLSTEMELPQNRESVLHFFEQVRRRYPKMQNFYAREKGEFVLEEEKESGAYRWTSIESKRVNSGVVNPETYEEAAEQHRKVLELIPFELSVSPLDCESLSVMFGFDFTCRGNQNEILAEAIGIAPESCKTQCRVSFETRTNAFHVRADDFPEDQLSVYLTVRRYDSLGPNETYAEEFDRLSGLCRDLVDEYLVSSVLLPLQKAISLR